MEDCIFCKIVKGDIPSKKLTEDELVLSIMSLENHPLVITKKHLENIYDLDPETGAAIMKMSVEIANAVKKGLNAEGVSIVQSNEAAAGQDVFHYHMHIKPRWVEGEEEKKQNTYELIKEAL